MSDEPLLVVEDLEKHYPVRRGLLQREVGRIRAVDGVDLAVSRGETLGLVGESGSGKSSTARTLLRLEEPTGGTVRFDGESITDFGRRQLREFRRSAQLVLQDPSSAFDPRLTVGEAVAEPLKIHGLRDADRRREIAADLLERVGLSAEDASSYPHEFSGGEKQRIAVARALVLNPDLLVADEPVSSLDARRREELLALLEELQSAFELSIVLISHDIDVVARVCDRVAVMYLGQIVERGPVESVVEDPQHPYTRTLVSAVPSLDPTEPVAAAARIDGGTDAADPPSGCRFHPRCPSIVPPEEHSLAEGTWQSLADLRFELAYEFETAEAFQGSLEATEPAAAASPDGGELESPPESRAMEADLRRAYGLPERIDDGPVDEALGRAAAALGANDLDGAVAALATPLESPCERVEPVAHGEGSRDVRCIRYDPDRELARPDPTSWSG